MVYCSALVDVSSSKHHSCDEDEKTVILKLACLSIIGCLLANLIGYLMSNRLRARQYTVSDASSVDYVPNYQHLRMPPSMQLERAKRRWMQSLVRLGAQHTPRVSFSSSSRPFTATYMLFIPTGRRRFRSRPMGPIQHTHVTGDAQSITVRPFICSDNW